MKNFIYFLFLILTFSLGKIDTQAQNQACANLEINGTNSKIAIDASGNYVYRIQISNSGLTLTGLDMDISILTTQFTCSNITNQTLNGVASGTSGITNIDFPLSSPVEDISLTPSAFGAVPTISITGAIPSPICDLTGGVIINTSTWGCTNSTSLNYDASATFDNNTCIDEMCGFLEILQITIGNTASGVKLLVSLKNNGPFNLSTSSDNIAPFLTGPNSPASFSVNNGTTELLNIAANGGIQTVEFVIASGLEDLTDSTMSITGHFTINSLFSSSSCDINIYDYEIDINHLGCLDVNSFNFDPLASVSNNSCIENISVQKTITNPLCQGDPGSIILDINGGTPNSSGNYMLNTFGQDITQLGAGQYTFQVTDFTPTSMGGPIVKNIDFTIVEAQEYVCDLQLTGSIFTAAPSGGSFTGWYYWLLDGVVIDSNQTGQFNYTTPGVYSCYIETFPNALGQQCWAYSNDIVTTTVGAEEYESKGISLYPNPNNGQFAIELQNYSSNSITANIYDIQGRMVYNYLSDNFNGLLELNDLNLENGMYQIVLENNNYVYRSKFVIK